jgi:hypothetical protein
MGMAKRAKTRAVGKEVEVASSPFLEVVWGGKAQSDSAASRAPLPSITSGVLVGRVVGCSQTGEPLVQYGTMSGAESRPARSTVALGASSIGNEVVLAFEGGDLACPIVIGLLQSASPTVAAYRDGQRLVFEAEDEIVLRCGKASITLTRAGKVLLRGAYVSSSAAGVNRIKGGSVQIN